MKRAIMGLIRIGKQQPGAGAKRLAARTGGTAGPAAHQQGAARWLQTGFCVRSRDGRDGQDRPGSRDAFIMAVFKNYFVLVFAVAGLAGPAEGWGGAGAGPLRLCLMASARYSNEKGPGCAEGCAKAAKARPGRTSSTAPHLGVSARAPVSVERHAPG